MNQKFSNSEAFMDRDYVKIGKMETSEIVTMGSGAVTIGFIMYMLSFLMI
jgi:hypothetical protein